MKYVKEICFIIILGLIIASVFIHFDKYFNYTPQDTTLDDWLKTASYFNNVLSPFLLLLSIILLFLTWRTTRSELKATNDNLDLDKAIKVITVMLDAINSQLHKKVPSSQLAEAFDKVANGWISGSYKDLPIFETNEETNILNQKLIVIGDGVKYSHYDLLTNFGNVNLANSLSLKPYDHDTFLSDAIKFHMINAYQLNLTYKESPSVIQRYHTTLEFIKSYESKPLIKEILIDLFVFSIDEIIIKSLNRCPLIKKHPVFIEAIHSRL